MTTKDKLDQAMSNDERPPMQAELRETIHLLRLTCSELISAAKHGMDTKRMSDALWAEADRLEALNTRPAPEPQPATAGDKGAVTFGTYLNGKRVPDSEAKKLWEQAALQSTPPPSAEGNEERLRRLAKEGARAMARKLLSFEIQERHVEDAAEEALAALTSNPLAAQSEEVCDVCGLGEWHPFHCSPFYENGHPFNSNHPLTPKDRP